MRDVDEPTLRREVLGPRTQSPPPWLVAAWIALGGASACLWIVITILYFATGAM